MANQISNVQANAFITATTTNKQDFQDSKKLFKESLQEALQSASDRAKVQVYQEAVRGFLLEIGEEEDYIQACIQRIKKSASRLKALNAKAESKSKYGICRLASVLWKPLSLISIGGAVIVFIINVMELLK